MMQRMRAVPGDAQEVGFGPAQAADENSYPARLRQLAAVTGELAAAATMDSVVDVVVAHVADAVHAVVATLMLRDGDDLVLVGAHGVKPGNEEHWASFRLSDDTPAGEAVRTGAPVAIAGAAQIEKRYPMLRDQMPAQRSIVCLPMSAGPEALGVIGLTFENDWLPEPFEVEFLATFAGTCAQAIRRIRATEEAEDRATKLAFLADASVELASSLDYRSTLTRVAELAVPTLADWCAVDILQDGAPTTLAVAHVDPAKVAWAWELQERYPPDPDAPTGVPNVVRTGVSELYEEITDEMLVAGARDEEHLRLARELRLRSALMVPLNARGRTLGVITLIRAETTRRYSDADLRMAEDLGRRAAVAIDNALLHSETQDVALQLQRAVLPGRLDDVTGWQIATHYSPGGKAEVGGDFFDAVALGDGRLAVFIGDVMGHGLAAAAAMAHMRAAVRAFLSIDPDPACVVARLDEMFERLELTQLVTLAYAVLDPAAGSLGFVNAGHYPPLLVGREGTPHFAETAPRRPLGAGGDDRTATVVPVAAGETVLLYTDGVIERRGEIIDVGLRRLRERAATLARRELSVAVDELMAQLRGDEGDDDVTAVAVRIPGAEPG
jgi:GAF domain-containing protein